VASVEEAAMSSFHATKSPLLLWEEQALREKAEDLLSVADRVAREGWGDTVAAHLRQAAHDLLQLARSEERGR
jgi:hypothetical protein